MKKPYGVCSFLLTLGVVLAHPIFTMQSKINETKDLMKKKAYRFVLYC